MTGVPGSLTITICNKITVVQYKSIPYPQDRDT